MSPGAKEYSFGPAHFCCASLVLALSPVALAPVRTGEGGTFCAMSLWNFAGGKPDM